MNRGHCPECKQPVTKVEAEPINIKAGKSAAVQGFSYLCPSCHCVLGIGIDSGALKEQIVSAVSDAVLAVRLLG